MQIFFPVEELDAKFGIQEHGKAGTREHGTVALGTLTFFLDRNMEREGNIEKNGHAGHEGI